MEISKALSAAVFTVNIIVQMGLAMGNPDPYYFTMVGVGVPSAETGQPYIDCYTEPNDNATVRMDRQAFFRPAAPSSVPALVTFNVNASIQSSSEQSTAYRLRLQDLAVVNRAGVYYCSVEKRGANNSVIASDRMTMSVIRSTARFFPSDGRFTKTFNIRDRSASVDFTSTVGSTSAAVIRQYSGSKGQSNPSDPWQLVRSGTGIRSFDFNGMITSTISSGVYSIHLTSARNQQRGGAVTVLIRECHAGRYNGSTACTLVCPSCHHGGICHASTGRCLCPPGFKGDNCEQACGSNRFGRNCEYTCDIYSSRANASTHCRDLRFCLPQPYGCSCAPGYMGYACDQLCPGDMYGAGCTEKCNCASGTCDGFTGQCMGSTACLPGWKGSACHECADGFFGANCTGTIAVSNTPKLAGIPTVRVRCNTTGGRVITTAPVTTALYRKDPMSGSLSEAGITRVPLTSSPAGGATFRVENAAVEDIFVCVFNDVSRYLSTDYRGTNLNVLPELPGPPVFTSASTTSVTISWDDWIAAIHEGDPPLVGYLVYYRLANTTSWTRYNRGNPLATTETIANLSPETDYTFGVSAIRSTVNGEGSIQSVNATTSCLPPQGILSNVRVHQAPSPRQLHITWGLPLSDFTRLNSNCRSGFTNLTIYYCSSAENRDAGTEQSVTVSVNSPGGHYLDALKPGSEYNIYVTLWNKDSQGPRSDLATGTTAKRRRSTATVAWVLFGVAFALLIAFVLFVFCYCERLN